MTLLQTTRGSTRDPARVKSGKVGGNAGECSRGEPTAISSSVAREREAADSGSSPRIRSFVLPSTPRLFTALHFAIRILGDASKQGWMEYRTRFSFPTGLSHALLECGKFHVLPVKATNQIALANNVCRGKATRPLVVTPFGHENVPSSSHESCSVSITRETSFCNGPEWLLEALKQFRYQ